MKDIIELCTTLNTCRYMSYYSTHVSETTCIYNYMHACCAVSMINNIYTV